MTTGLRWRIVILQVGLIGIFGFCAGFLFWGSNFVDNTVRDQLTAQQITFPTAGSAALKALPAADATAMSAYAGQTLTTGAQAETYANHFIGAHLTEVYKGDTYSQVSALAAANPKDAGLAAAKQTLFMGNTLRGLLLNAYGWSQVGLYAFWAGIGLAVASFAVLLALLYELVVAPRRETEDAAATGRKRVPASVV
jgi:hypothetical protein